MTTTPLAPAITPATSNTVNEMRPPGERYFRHPGDVLQLVLWGSVTAVLAIFIQIATATSQGVTADIARATGRIPLSGREVLLALTQVVVVVVPVFVVVLLVARQRWRRLGIVVLAAAAGAAFFLLLDALLDLSSRLPDAVDSGTWVASTRFPSLTYVAGAAAVATVGKPWLARPWRRATGIGLLLLALVMAIAGSAGVPELLLAVAAGATIGAALLVVLGAPNRRPAPAVIADALRGAGLDVTGMTLQRAEGGRSQLYRTTTDRGDVFVKVYAQDSRDADLLYRGLRALLLRGTNDDWASMSLKHDVEHEAFLVVLAREAGVTCPHLETITTLADGSMVLALENVDGRRLDELAPDDVSDALLDAIWGQTHRLHEGRLAHRALRSANVLVRQGEPVLIDFGFGEESASDRMQAVDRAELLVSLALLVGTDRAIASAARVLPTPELATALPYLQPLALSAATRKAASKSLLKELRADTAAATGTELVALERLVRVRPKTLVTIALLVGAFYFLLPQLADAGGSFQELKNANFGWLAVAIVMSGFTYLASAVCLRGGVPQHVPLVPLTEAQLASSFVNRVTPANVGGMALNVRFLQKAGVEPAQAVTGVGLNSLIGAIVHIVLLFVFFWWAGQTTSGFKIPGSSKLLVIIAVVLALVGAFLATRRGRNLFRKHVVTFLTSSYRSMVVLAKSPAKLAALFGGSVGVTLAYIAALAATVAAFQSGVTVAQVGAVYLGASMIAAAAPTPGGLGAIEAALVAGFTGIGMDPAVAVAAVLSYRVVTYWLPIVPGWLAFRHIQRRGYV